MGTRPLTPFSPAQLRVIICEDEILLATELAVQMEALQATVVAVVTSLEDLRGIVAGGADANAALLDVQLADGLIYPIIPALEKTGMALAFFSAYLAQDCPPQCAHIPWLDKLTSAQDIVDVLCAAHNARRHGHSH